MYTTYGLYTFIDFCCLRVLGSDETSEPQPIPSVLVGYDKEWLSLTPQSLHFWVGSLHSMLSVCFGTKLCPIYVSCQYNVCCVYPPSMTDWSAVLLTGQVNAGAVRAAA